MSRGGRSTGWHREVKKSKESLVVTMYNSEGNGYNRDSAHSTVNKYRNDLQYVYMY